MIRWLANLLRGPQRGRFLRLRYDAAQTNADNTRHWASADGLSATAANSPGVRRILRNRSRYEVANNSYARGIVNTLANYVVGTGPRLQSLEQSPTDNALVEREFSAWANAINLQQKLWTMRVAQAQDGESFGLFTTNEELGTPVTLDLRVVEADQVTTPDFRFPITRAVDGIVFDRFGNPAAYHVLRTHPGDETFGAEYDTLPAAEVIHLFRAERPGQARGIPEIMPALPLFAYLRRYTLASVSAAEMAANHAGVLYTDMPAGQEAVPGEPFELIEVERSMLTTLPDGWKLNQLKAEQPGTSNVGRFQVAYRGTASAS